jgi:RHS repeat-associated protein
MTAYVYDGVGNRMSMKNSAGMTAYAYDADDRLVTAGTNSFTYDANGNRLTKTSGTTTMTYFFDALNRLTKVSGGGIAALYQYDGDGNRVWQQAGAASYQYVLDVARRAATVLEEDGSDGSIDFQYGLSLLSGSSATLEQFHQQDGLGSTVDVTDANDTMKASYTYDPWGKLLNPIDALGTKDKFKFTGEALDPQTGLYYLRARYYDAVVGRFISRDPFAGRALLPATTNRYVYVNNSPLRFRDRTGLAPEPTGAGDLGLVSGVLPDVWSFGPPLPGPGMPQPGIGVPYPPVVPPLALNPAPKDPCSPGPGNPGPGCPSWQTNTSTTTFTNGPSTSTNSPTGSVPGDPGDSYPWTFAPGPSSIFDGILSGFSGFNNILSEPPVNDCGFTDVCSSANTQAPVTSGQASDWNSSTDSGWSP